MSLSHTLNSRQSVSAGTTSNACTLSHVGFSSSHRMGDLLLAQHPPASKIQRKQHHDVIVSARQCEVRQRGVDMLGQCYTIGRHGSARGRWTEAQGGRGGMGGCLVVCRRAGTQGRRDAVARWLQPWLYNNKIMSCAARYPCNAPAQCRYFMPSCGEHTTKIHHV